MSMRLWLSAGSTAALVVCGSLVTAGAATISFPNNKGCETAVIPAGVTSAKVVATGSGGQAIDDSLGGTGAVISGTLKIPRVGEKLDVCVDYGGGAAGTGGADGGVGGGASGVALGGNFSDPLLIAGGGGGGAGSSGGAGNTIDGGDAGSPGGAIGAEGSGAAAGFGADGGTQTTGGAGGTGGGGSIANHGAVGQRFSNAGPGVGGAGGTGNYGAGGGGGAGYYGGGGGGGSDNGSEALPPGGAGGGGADFCARAVSDCALGGTSNAVYGTASVTISYVLRRLNLTESASAKTVTAGHKVTYALTVRNTGNTLVKGIKLCDRLPRTLVYAGSGPRGAHRGAEVCWTIAKLTPGASGQVHLTVHVLPGARGRIVNHASASAGGVDTVFASAVISTAARR
jgi:uncharacterized repeat protein (TIGR01451 family)